MKQVLPGFNSIGAIALLALAVGCATNAQQTENLLSTAGFTTVLANTPQLQKQLKALKPNKMTRSQQGGETRYLYADPAHYQMYVGDPSQYQTYQQLRRANSLSQDQVTQLNFDTLNGIAP